MESWNARLIEPKDNGVSESFTMNTELLQLRELFAGKEGSDGQDVDLPEVHELQDTQTI